MGGGISDYSMSLSLLLAHLILSAFHDQGLLSLLIKKALLVLLAEEVLDLVAQALLLLVLGRGSTVAAIFLLVDVAFAAALECAVSNRALVDYVSFDRKPTPVWKLS